MRATGCLLDERATSDLLTADMRVRSPVRVSASADLTDARGPRIYQKSAGACVAFSIVRAAHVSRVLHGASDDELDSPLFCYWVGRMYERRGLSPDPDFVPPDRGMYPKMAMDAARNVGMLAWSELPYDDSKVLTPPPREAFMKAHQRRGLTYYRIEDDESRYETIAEALRRGFPVVFDISITQSFFDNDGSIVGEMAGQEKGRHMLCALAANDDYVTVDNWWDSWGDDGMGKLSRSIITGPRVANVYAIVATP